MNLVPFDEDSKDSDVWFLDHDYMDTMFTMFKKVNAREKIIGWYHTGSKLGANDINIHKLIKKHFSQPILVVIDAIPRDIGLPLDAYVMVEESKHDGTPNSLTFDHIHSEIGAEEAEEVGVEHLLRDIRNMAAGNTLKQRTISLLDSLKGLQGYLISISNYLKKVDSQVYPINQPILSLLQVFFNLVPDHSDCELSKALLMYTNDQAILTYLSSMVRSILSIHELINNKKMNKDLESNNNSNSIQTGVTTVNNQNYLSQSTK